MVLLTSCVSCWTDVVKDTSTPQNTFFFNIREKIHCFPLYDKIVLTDWSQVTWGETRRPVHPLKMGTHCPVDLLGVVQRTQKDELVRPPVHWCLDMQVRTKLTYAIGLALDCG